MLEGGFRDFASASDWLAATEAAYAEARAREAAERAAEVDADGATKAEALLGRQVWRTKEAHRRGSCDCKDSSFVAHIGTTFTIESEVGSITARRPHRIVSTAMMQAGQPQKPPLVARDSPQRHELQFQYSLRQADARPDSGPEGAAGPLQDWPGRRLPWARDQGRRARPARLLPPDSRHAANSHRAGNTSA